jgi:UDP-N-acetylmuramate dehydrogenase
MLWPTGSVRTQERLANHTSFRIGGPAQWFAEPSTMEELLTLLQAAHGIGIPVSMIGGGTNLLVADRGIRGLVVHLGRAFRHITVHGLTDTSGARVCCGAAVPTQRLVTLACQHGWGDLEALAGLPGQVGGAVVMNAQNIGRFVQQVTVVSLRGTVERLTHEQLGFAYRYTALEPGVIVDVSFQFPTAPAERATEGVKRTLAYRNATQELRLPSAGCAFKNTNGQSAGRLIDQAGLKGTRFGDAQISRRHANFIVNLGGATCDDVLALMEYIQRCVARAFGVWLEPEIRVLGERWS